MSKPLNKKLLVICVAGAAALAAANWFTVPVDVQAHAATTPGRETDGKSGPGVISQPPAMPLPNLALRERAALSPTDPQALFSPRSWRPATPLAAAPVAAPPALLLEPVAPPLPFYFVGMLDEKGAARQVFLARGDQLLVLKTNDVVDGRYRIDAITDNAVDLTYLPLNQKQQLPIQMGTL